MALGKMRGRAIPLLEKLVAHRDESVRAFAVAALRETNAKEVIPLLRSALTDPSAKVGFQAAVALAHFGVSPVAHQLEDAAKGGDLYALSDAIVALYELGQHSYLEAALEDSREQVRYYAAASLKRIEGRLALPMIYSALKDSSPAVRSAAMDAFAKIASREDMDRLKVFLDDKSDEYVRFVAAKTLLTLGYQEGTIVLEEIMESESRTLRRLVAEALGSVNSGSSLAVLRKALRDSNPDVRVSAIGSLARRGEKSVLPALEGLLHDDNIDVIGAASDALVRLSDQHISAGLEAALRDSKSYTRIYAAAAILRLDGR